MFDSPSGPWRPSGVLSSVLHCLTAAVASAYPMSMMLDANVAALSVDWSVIAAFVTAAAISTGVLIVALRIVMPRLDVRATWVSALILASAFYAEVVNLLALDPQAISVALLYAAGSVVVVTMGVRPWLSHPRDPLPLLVLVGLLVGVNVTGIVQQLHALQRSQWDDVASTLVAATPVRNSNGRSGPNIYYIVLDGFGRADVLERYYEVRLDGFTDFLKSSGFVVPSEARSNYAQTDLSLASTLNLAYLDEMSAQLRPSTPSRPFFGHLIQYNRLMVLAKRAGYRVVVISSDYLATQRLAVADECACQKFGLDAMEEAAIASTPLAAAPLGRWTYEGHRKKILYQLDEIAKPRSADGPTFVFAHLIAPHAPFIFRPDGSPRRAPVLLSFGDGSHFRGSKSEYVVGYREQVEFVALRMTAIVNTLLARPGPRPVIVLHGDHGPGSMVQWEDPAATNMAERMNIFAAYLLPQDKDRIYPTITPVNGARILANRYFGTELALLPDSSWFSTWRQPTRFIPLTDKDLTLTLDGPRSSATSPITRSQRPAARRR